MYSMTHPQQKHFLQNKIHTGDRFYMHKTSLHLSICLTKEKAEILNLQSRVVLRNIKKKRFFFFHLLQTILPPFKGGLLFSHCELKQPVYRTRKLQGLGGGCSSASLVKLPVWFRVSLTTCFFSLGQILQWQLRRKLNKTKQILNRNKSSCKLA